VSGNDGFRRFQCGKDLFGFILEKDRVAAPGLKQFGGFFRGFALKRPGIGLKAVECADGVALEGMGISCFDGSADWQQPRSAAIRQRMTVAEKRITGGSPYRLFNNSPDPKGMST
jgi:hypothetical protein